MRHQQQLLEHLEQEPRQRAVLLHAPVGAGLNAVIVRLAASTARRGESVVIITALRMLADQWMYRLTQAQADNVASLKTSSDVLLELDRVQSSRDPSRILIVTIQLLSQGAGRRLSEVLRPGLLIVDKMPGLASGVHGELIEKLASGSGSVIILSEAGGPDWFRPTESIDWPQREILHGWPSIETMMYQPSEHEKVVYDRALELLNEATGDLVLHPWTRPALHASILRLIASLSGDHIYEQENGDDDIAHARRTQVKGDIQQALLQEAWSVVDSFEELGDDGRLEAVHTLVLRAEKEHRLCIVTTELNVEANYVAAYLRSNSIPVSVLTDAGSPLQWQQLQEALSERDVLVATNMAFSLPFDLPERTQVVWWSAPQTIVQSREWLALAARAPQPMVIAIRAQPPLPGEGDLQAILDTLRNE